MSTTEAPRNPDTKYERTDVSVGPVVKFVIGLTAAILVTGVLMWVLFLKLESIRAKADPAPPPLAPAGVRDPIPPVRVARFPKPRLETHPLAASAIDRARETQQLASYGWVDRPAGVVRIPIERAIDITLERGLPVRPQASAQPAAAGGNSNGARP
jgi:hypothetical protein